MYFTRYRPNYKLRSEDDTIELIDLANKGIKEIKTVQHGITTKH